MSTLGEGLKPCQKLKKLMAIYWCRTVVLYEPVLPCNVPHVVLNTGKDRVLQLQTRVTANCRPFLVQRLSKAHAWLI